LFGALLGGTLGWPMKLDPVALGIAVATSADEQHPVGEVKDGVT
jgi:hypothetical protein